MRNVIKVMLNAWGFRINKSFGALSSLQVLRIGHIIRITCFFFLNFSQPLGSDINASASPSLQFLMNVMNVLGWLM